MADALSLMQVLVGQGKQPNFAAEALADALEAGVDPMRWCAVHLGLGEAEVMRRAAEWAGFPYQVTVPTNVVNDEGRVEHLASVRFVGIDVMGTKIAFAAPDFFGILNLKRAAARTPRLNRRICLVPYSGLRTYLATRSRHSLIDYARQNLTRHWPFAAAQLELTKWVRWGFVLAILFLLGALLLAPVLGLGWLLPLWALLVLAPASLRVVALCTPRSRDTSRPISDRELPVYSVMVPLRDEANMVEQLARALARLNYPADKLDIIFVVEAISAETIAAVQPWLADPRFSIVEVPDNAPRTKPKALNYALPLCRGEFVVVFDAEDRPEPSQLRSVAAQFRSDPDVACIQARLVIANGERGWLASVFAGEYAGLFTVLLPALARWRLFMPLGGTSNHFRLETLRALGGWDAFNVTEDADLGVRLARRGLKTAVSARYTLEDAPLSFKPWSGQRTRWMKGWMQTYLVHNRRPHLLVRDFGWRHALLFQVLLLGMILAPLLHGGFLIGLVTLYCTGVLNWPVMDIWAVLCVLTFGVGQGAAIATNVVGLQRTGQTSLWTAQLSVPIYWVLIGITTVQALFELVRRPHYWFKTPHQVIERMPTARKVALSPVTGLGDVLSVPRRA